MNIKLAIIGSGISALGALRGIHENITQSKQKIDITIFEESNNPFTGFAYNPEHTQYEHLLNANTDAMQIGGKETFKEWLEKNHAFCISVIKKQPISIKLKKQCIQSIEDILQNKKDIYIPRNIYGLFLQHEANKTIAKLRHAGCTVTVLPRSKITAVEEKKTATLGNVFFHKNKTTVKINLKDKKYFFDKVLITAGNTIDISNTPNFLYTSNIKDKITQLILQSIKRDKTSINIAINHATLAGLDAQRTVNECVQSLRERDLIPALFKVNTYIISNNLARVPFPNSNLKLPNHKNEFLSLEEFKRYEGMKDFNPITVFENLLKLEMKTALSEFNVTPKDIQNFHLKLLKQQKVKLGGEEFFNQTNQHFENIKLKDLAKVKDIAIFRYYRKIMLNSTLLIYYIFENYKEKFNLKTMEPFLVANLALSPSFVIQDTLAHDLNIDKYIVTQKKVQEMDLHFDLSIDTWTRDPKFEKPLFKSLPTNSTNLRVVKLDTALANNGYVAYHKGIEAGSQICTSSKKDPARGLFNDEEPDKNQTHFT